jgi:hypothetical protein
LTIRPRRHTVPRKPRGQARTTAAGSTQARHEHYEHAPTLAPEPCRPGDNLVRSALPDVQLIQVASVREFFEAPEGRFDALLASAEGGSAWTLLHPRFGVVVPRPNVVTGPIALARPRNAPELHDYVSTWVALKRRDGTARHGSSVAAPDRPNRGGRSSETCSGGSTSGARRTRA